MPSCNQERGGGLVLVHIYGDDVRGTYGCAGYSVRTTEYRLGHANLDRPYMIVRPPLQHVTLGIEATLSLVRPRSSPSVISNKIASDQQLHLYHPVVFFTSQS